jgi:tryptophan-rich sensory protein
MAMSKTAISVFKLVICIGACLAAGFIGSMFTTPAIPTWYAGLVKPPFSPPNWVFAPVWTTLYVLMGIAAYIVWRKGTGTEHVRSGLILFIIQLVLNLLWSVFFFGLRSPLAGVIVIMVLWVLILLTIIRFFRVSRLAGWLMVPYILWVTFASALNIAVWVLNP